jgi:glycosyltransferase involved in cell wall biosynthesis
MRIALFTETFLPKIDGIVNTLCYLLDRLAIVGDGPAREELEASFVGTNTVFTGFLRGDDLARVYAAADLFTFPSANETLGNVVLEAMASGLPVVAPRSGGGTGQRHRYPNRGAVCPGKSG